MFKGFLNLPIKTKLGVLVSLLIGGISIFIFFYFPSRLGEQALQSIEAKAQTILMMTAFSVSPALDFEDLKNIEEVLESAKQNKDLVYFLVFNESGKLVKAFKKAVADKAKFLESKQKMSLSEDGLIYKAMSPIMKGDDEIGQLYLGISLKGVRAQIKKSRMAIALVSLTIFGIGMIVVLGISTIITRPLSQMVKTVVQISKGDLNSKALVTSHDEIGILAESFNKMTSDLRMAMQKEKELAAAAAAETVERAKALELQKTFNQLKAAHSELKETTAQLIQSEKLAALGELTAGVAHELNQPLNVTKIICQSILRDIQRGEYDQEIVAADLPEVVNQINKMAEIIDHMRVFTRRSEGEVKEKIDVNTLVKGAFKFLEQQLKDHNIEVIKELRSDLPQVIGDPVRLEQVFMNLITNARHALESCEKKNKKMEIKSLIDKSFVVVEIRDNGNGISEELKSKIFQPFFTTKEPGKGTGLGLSVSNKIMEEHRGKIELESQAGEGALFRVSLPVGKGEVRSA